MFLWFRKKWYAHLRRIDLRVLWPECKHGTTCLNQAKAAFSYHAFHDEAWQELGEEGIKASIDAMK